MDCRTAMRRDYRQRRVSEKRTLFELYYCYGNYHLNFEQYIMPFIMSHFPFLSCLFQNDAAAWSPMLVRFFITRIVVLCVQHGFLRDAGEWIERGFFDR